MCVLLRVLCAPLCARFCVCVVLPGLCLCACGGRPTSYHAECIYSQSSRPVVFWAKMCVHLCAVPPPLPPLLFPSATSSLVLLLGRALSPT